MRTPDERDQHRRKLEATAKSLEDKRRELHSELVSGVTPGPATDWFKDRMNQMGKVNRVLDLVYIRLSVYEDECKADIAKYLDLMM